MSAEVKPRTAGRYPPGQRCRHCGRCKVNRPRGLCWSCYYTPGVKGEYAITSKFARRGVGNGYRNSPPPPHPTTAPSGSAEKVAVLAERVAGGYALWHPADAP